jgi:hypothetical protein
MAMKHGDIEYCYVVGSDVVRNGMYVEINDQPDGSDAILEIFFSDVSYDMVVTLFKPNIPLEVIEWAISVARERLPVKPGTFN